jgi:galactoside O-acetyltransferase
MPSSVYSPEAFADSGGFRHAETTLHEPLVIVGLDKFRIERGVRIDAFCYLTGGRGVVLGARTHLAAGVAVGGGGCFETGWCAGLASGVRIVTGTDDPLEGLAGACIPPEFRAVRRGEVILEDFALVFTNAVILPDVRIGRGAVVAAGSVVSHSLQPWTVNAGNPLRKIGMRDSAKVEKAAEAMREKYGF